MKKILSVLLVILLSALTLLPINASAAETASAQTGASSGTTGDCTWKLDDNGTLTISGNGQMEIIYDFWEDTPWGKNIKSVVIENGVTNIGSYAFYQCGQLASVSIGNSVSSIGDEAFYDCGALEEIIIPDSVAVIGEGAFDGCASLRSINIPASVVDIGYWNAFGGCRNLSRITVSKENLKFDSRNNCNAIIETKSNRLIAGCKSTVIPASVKTIGNVAFEGSGLSSIKIPNNVNSIETGAFQNCSNLRSVTIPYGVEVIKSRVFSECYNLSKITLPKSITSIEGGAFDLCKKLSDVYYIGKEEDWNEVEISKYNNYYLIYVAEIHFVTLVGDANSDNIIDVRDVTAIQRHVSEYELLTGDALRAADIDGNGVVDISDATLLQRYLAEFVEEL